MKMFDIKSDINELTYQDEFKLSIEGVDDKIILDLTVDEILDLYTEVKHVVDNFII